MLHNAGGALLVLLAGALAFGIFYLTFPLTLRIHVFQWNMVIWQLNFHDWIERREHGKRLALLALKQYTTQEELEAKVKIGFREMFSVWTREWLSGHEEYPEQVAVTEVGVMSDKVRALKYWYEGVRQMCPHNITEAKFRWEQVDGWKVESLLDSMPYRIQQMEEWRMFVDEMCDYFQAEAARTANLGWVMVK